MAAGAARSAPSVGRPSSAARWCRPGTPGPRRPLVQRRPGRRDSSGEALAECVGLRVKRT
eukprot:7470750-Alexandrium_andersonii.AAC.1